MKMKMCKDNSIHLGVRKMEQQRQMILRMLAEQQAKAENPEQQALALGTLELLEYVDQLVMELQHTTESCCEAMFLVYENVL